MRSNKPVLFLLWVAMILGGSIPLAHTEEMLPNETKEHRDARMGWWREARYGMFIHWGLYAIPAGEWNGKKVWGGGEWIQHCGHIPVADYAALAAQFNPVKFNADEWVSMAKKAGIRYIVITAKHHDGFAMFASKASPYNTLFLLMSKTLGITTVMRLSRLMSMPGSPVSQCQSLNFGDFRESLSPRA